jgi:integrase/recombinase XerD
MRTYLSERIALEHWPKLDRTAWLRALGGDVLSDAECGAAAGWRESTRRLVERRYGSWLWWLRARALLDEAVPPEQRATKATVRAYAAELKAAGYADYTVAVRISALGAALRVMASQGEARFISRGGRRLRSAARRRLSISSRMRPAREIYDLGVRLMSEADLREGCSSRSLCQYRDGLLIALWACRPLRVSNLSMLRLGVHLIASGSAWSLKFSAEDTKPNRPFHCVWPSSLNAALVTYLNVVRPRLCAIRSPANALGPVWVSARGQEMSLSWVAQMIRRRTQSGFGVLMNPHLIRHIVTTETAERQPHQVADIVSMLGHSTLATSERYYNLAGASLAAQAYQLAVQARVQGGRRKSPSMSGCAETENTD